MRWFRMPDRVYYEMGSLAYLEKLGAERAFIVTDRVMKSIGYVDKVKEHLEVAGTTVEIFSDVEPDPSFETVMAGAEKMRRFKPDAIIALGGGSPMDAAKGMWVFYEENGIDAQGLKDKYMDVLGSTTVYDKYEKKARFVAIPTTSGTGSEVTAFAVITDKKTNVKYPLADYRLTPDVAIVDPELVMSVPAAVTADTGMDVLTHAIEAYVSILPSDYTDPLALQAIDLVFKYLPKVYKDGNDVEAREKLHNASCIAGMAFTNALLGINHSIAHNCGATFKIPHGRINAMLLPYVCEFNGSEDVTNFTKILGEERYMAPERFQDIARYIGLPASTPSEGVESVVSAIRKLMEELDMPSSLSEFGVKKEVFEANVDSIVKNALLDPCTGANPRIPSENDIKNILNKVF